MKILNLTSSEEQLMLVIWRLDSAFMRDIMANYPDPKPHQNTVSTFLKILIEKNYLKVEKLGRIFNYIPIITFEDYRIFQLDSLIAQLYDGNKQQLLQDLNTSFFNEKANKVKESKTIKEVITESLEHNAKANINPNSNEEVVIVKMPEKEKSKKGKKDKKKKKKKK